MEKDKDGNLVITQHDLQEAFIQVWNDRETRRHKRNSNKFKGSLVQRMEQAENELNILNMKIQKSLTSPNPGNN